MSFRTLVGSKFVTNAAVRRPHAISWAKQFTGLICGQWIRIAAKDDSAWRSVQPNANNPRRAISAIHRRKLRGSHVVYWPTGFESDLQTAFVYAIRNSRPGNERS